MSQAYTLNLSISIISIKDAVILVLKTPEISIKDACF